MKRHRFYLLAKMLQALAIAALMIGMVQGIAGDMWGELYLFISGILVFAVGRRMEKKIAGAEIKREHDTRLTTTAQEER